MRSHACTLPLCIAITLLFVITCLGISLKHILKRLHCKLLYLPAYNLVFWISGLRRIFLIPVFLTRYRLYDSNYSSEQLGNHYALKFSPIYSAYSEIFHIKYQPSNPYVSPDILYLLSKKHLQCIRMPSYLELKLYLEQLSWKANVSTWMKPVTLPTWSSRYLFATYCSIFAVLSICLLYKAQIKMNYRIILHQFTWNVEYMQHMYTANNLLLRKGGKQSINIFPLFCCTQKLHWTTLSSNSIRETRVSRAEISRNPEIEISRVTPPIFIVILMINAYSIDLWSSVSIS